ncbi:MAG: hypothetical protein AB6733_13250 [Clostridiaceae bacterium]
MYLNTKRKKIKIRNIVRGMFIMLGLILVIVSCLRFNNYDMRAMIIDSVLNLGVLYLFSVSTILAEIRDVSIYRNKIEKYIVRIVIIPSALFFSINASIGIYSNIKDIFISGYTENIVLISRVDKVTKGFSKAHIMKYFGKYRIHPGYVELSENTRYKVHIFPNSKIVIGISKI